MHRKHLIKAFALSVLAIVGVMVVSVSAAQAEYRLLLGGGTVSSIHLLLEFLPGYLEMENTLKIECTGGTGLIAGELKESNKKVTGSGSATFAGCFWVGQAKVCRIENAKGEAGKIDAAGSGEVTMKDEAGVLQQNVYRVTATSANFSTIFTSDLGGCTIPEEEVLSGTVSLLVLDALKAGEVVKLAHLRADNLQLIGKVKALAGEVHLRDLNLFTGEPSGEAIGIHLCNLAGNPAC